MKAKWFYCTCGCERLVKSRTTNCDSFQPVLFRRATRARLGEVRTLPRKAENGVHVPHMRHFGYYCPNCWTYWGTTLAEVRRNRRQRQRLKYDDAVASWHLLPELRDGEAQASQPADSDG